MDIRLDKVIIRTVLSTLCAIAVLCAVAFGLATWLYPSTMMKIAYELGDDPSAIRYAYRSYERTDELYYVAFAMEVAIGVDDYEEIEFYAELFTQDENFSKYCEETDVKRGYETGTYAKYAYGQLVIAEYANGKKQEAFDHAVASLNGGFSQNNAMVALLFATLEKGDWQTQSLIMVKMQALSETLPDGADKTYLDEILNLLNS